MVYSDKLPRRIDGEECQGLALNGNKCGAKAFIETTMPNPHPSPGGAHWVRVKLCKKCSLPWEVEKCEKEAKNDRNDNR